MQVAGFRSAIAYTDLDQDVVRRLLGILDKNVEVTVFIEDPGIEQLILHVAAGAPLVGLDQIFVGIRRLRILVQILHVRVRRRAVEVEVILLDVFAMVAFAVGQPEQAFLENRVFAVPQRHAEAQQLHVVGDAGQTVFAPVIGARAGLIVGEVVPRVAVLAVVLANCSPLPLAKVGSPLPPGLFAGANL